jgi:hypothetical protein
MPSQKAMERFNRRIAAVEEHYHHHEHLHVEYVQVLTALMEVFGEPNPEVLCDRDITEADMIAKLVGYAFDVPRILGGIEAPDLEVPGGIGRIYAALNKGAGKEWELLSHPSDPFPSDPCAHNETEDVSLDLATGSLYHDRQYVHKLFRKDLTAFRARVAKKYPDMVLPPLRD